MKRELVKWKVSTLTERHLEIEFPEYQREPNVWSSLKRRRLIDSMRRGFDISTIYLCRVPTKKAGVTLFECVDGRQRVRTLLTLYGKSIDDSDLHFEYQPENEVFREPALGTIPSFRTDSPEDTPEGRALVNMRRALWDFEISVVELSDISDKTYELALLFQRCNLGQPLNAGEKLNAMIGDARDAVFQDLSAHPFFTELNIPDRRFAQELVAAQVLMQVFSITNDKQPTRTRHSDLQKFFKDHQEFTQKEKELLGILKTRLTELGNAASAAQLRIDNRAIAVTYAIFHWLEVDKRLKPRDTAKVLETMRKTIRWQSSENAANWDAAYKSLAEFQLNVTQAAVEEYAVVRRHNLLKKFLTSFLGDGQLAGDNAYQRQAGKDPSQLRKNY